LLDVERVLYADPLDEPLTFFRGCTQGCVGRHDLTTYMAVWTGWLNDSEAMLGSFHAHIIVRKRRKKKAFSSSFIIYFFVHFYKKTLDTKPRKPSNSFLSQLPAAP
jgi:hypothetical protein